MNSSKIGAVVVVLLMVVGGTVALAPHTYYQVPPGTAGIKFSANGATTVVRSGGHWKWPLLDHVAQIPVHWTKQSITISCLTQELTPVDISLRLVYKIPEEPAMLAKLFEDFRGDPFDELVAPHIQSIVQTEVRKRAAAAMAHGGVITTETIQRAFEEVAPLLKGQIQVRLESVDLPADFVTGVNAPSATEVSDNARKDRLKNAELESELAKLQSKTAAELLRANIEAYGANPVSAQLFQRMIDKWDGKSPLFSPGAGEKRSSSDH